jgi:hypothetical protein
MVIKKLYKNHDLNHLSLCSEIFCPIHFFPFCVEFGQTEQINNTMKEERRKRCSRKALQKFLRR